MNLKIINRGNEADLLLEGRIDANVAPQLQQALVDAAERFDKLTLDFGKVPYISSAGLRALRVLRTTVKKERVLRSAQRP